MGYKLMKFLMVLVKLAATFGCAYILYNLTAQWYVDIISEKAFSMEESNPMGALIYGQVTVLGYFAVLIITMIIIYIILTKIINNLFLNKMKYKSYCKMMEKKQRQYQNYNNMYH